MQELYADVIVNITQESLDKTFQYRIPEKLRKSVREGTAVRIPFGRGTRTVDGYVVGISAAPKIEESRIRPILEIQEGRLPIEGRLLQLAVWMKKTYGSTMNRALQTVLPVKEKEKASTADSIRVIADRETLQRALEESRQKGHKAKERALRSLLDPGGESCPDRLRFMKTAGVTSSVLQSLQKDGLISVETHRVIRNPEDLLEDADEAENGLSVPEQEGRELTPGQKKVRDGILAEWNGQNRPCLIRGITGSGKTLIYMDLIGEVLREGRQAIVLIPEISLSWQTVRRFRRRFGDAVAVLHSRMSKGERFDQMERARTGEAKIVIGPRSALFTPFPDTGLILIDEEHEPSYRSEKAPCYDARETALERARMEQAHVVFGSATPSVDAWYRCRKGEFAGFVLDSRYGGAGLPSVEIVDMRKELQNGNRSVISSRLQLELEERLRKKEQSMLFLNRRGVSGFLSCRSCGEVIRCPHCDVSLTLHNNGKLVCHYCGYETDPVRVCPHCGSPFISGFRVGTQKVESELKSRFPQARILRMDADSTRGKNDYRKILRTFAMHQADILVGTQMIVKGHDFPDVTLVGVLAADLSLGENSYRAAERTYQLLVQAVGRAGRGSVPGLAVIQTYQPDHYSIRAAASQDYDAFYSEEIAGREFLNYPPVWQMLAVRGSCTDGQRLQRAFLALREFLRKYRRSEQTVLLGPTPETVARIKDNWREVLYVREPDRQEIIRLRSMAERYIEINSGFRDIYFTFELNS